MNSFRVVFFVCLLLLQSVAQAGSALWTGINPALRSADGEQSKFTADRYYRVDSIQLKQKLSRASFEGSADVSTEIELPAKNGEIQRFKVELSQVMSEGLAAKYPDIKSYKVHGIDDVHATGRISISHRGFHGMISGPSGTSYIDPQGGDIYRSYSRKSHNNSTAFKCGVEGHQHSSPVGISSSRLALRTAGNLRVYRLAIAATSEYVSAVKNFGSTTDSEIKADVAAEINNAINRVNEIYERDLGIRLVIVPDSDMLWYTTAADADPYTNNSASAMLEENQGTIDAVIGLDNYDIGHVFSTEGGGLAALGSVCVPPSASDVGKAGGVTGLTPPTGEKFYIEYVAHEMGHQFSAQHTFNGTEGQCGLDPNRVQLSAFEPGSGSTIMSYAGICDEENIVNNAEAVFHAGSIEQIDDFTSAAGAGSTCGTLLDISNPNEPVVDAGSDFTIPRKTPFILTAAGTDADSDPLTYSWDQMDQGKATRADTLGTDLTTNSLFRSYLPQSDNTRHFPALGTTLRNQYDDSENLPCQSRELNFRVTVRDGNRGMGTDNVELTVDNASGPFQLTSFNSAQTLSPGNQQLNWDVANTDKAPVLCSEVDISLLTFNDSKTSYFENPLASNEPNDGSATVKLTDNSSSHARFKIQCSDNIFYDISDADLNITGSTAFSTTGNTVFYNTDGLLIHNSPTEDCVTSDVVIDDNDSTNDSSGGGSPGIFWLFSLLALLVYRKNNRTLPTVN